MKPEYIEKLLEGALDKDKLLLYYQPQIEISSGLVTGVEALARLESIDGNIPASEFIFVAEESGLIVKLGEQVLRKACTQGGYWHGMGYDGLTVSVNISKKQINKPGLYEAIALALRDSGLPPDRLQVELTEDAIISDLDLTEQFARMTAELGVSFAVDNFGAGYMSLIHLSRFTVNAMKIDPSFIRDIAKDGKAAAIAAAVVSLTKNLNIMLVAKGVEDPAQLSLLQSIGCEQAQGFLLGLPMSAMEITEMLSAQESSRRGRYNFG